MRDTQGRCKRCGVRYVWRTSQGPLRGAHCDECGVKLVQTTHRFKGPARRLEHGPIYGEAVIAARLKQHDISPTQADYIARRWR